jgi:PAS domain S-box-containing protein
MKGKDKTNRQPIEPVELRHRVAEVEAANTERQRAEEAVKELLGKIERAKQEWESTADSLPDLVCLVDDGGRIIRANRTVETWNLGRVVDVKGREVHELLHPGCTDSSCYLDSFWEEAWEEAMRGQPAQCEAYDDILKRHVLVRVQPWKDWGKGTAFGSTVVIARDITERKQAEEEIKRLAKFPSENPNPVLRVAKDGTILYANESSMPLLNVWGCQVNQPLPDYWHQFILDVLSSGSSKDTEIEYDGRILSLTFAPVVDADYVNLYGLDITARKRAEEEAQRRATQAVLAYEVGQRVSSTLELDELLSEIVTAVRDAFDYYGVMLLLLDEETERLTLQSIVGAYADIFPRDLCHAIGEGMTGYAAASGETQVSGDVSKDPHYVRETDEETKSELAVPIKSRQKVVGVLDIQSDEFDAFDEIDVMAMETLADEVAVAIENARLYKAVQQELTERKRAEEALRESEERYRSLTDDVLDSSAVGILILDSDFRVVWVNQALKLYFGLRTDEIVRKDKRQLIRERIADIFEDAESFAETVLATYNDNTYIENFECHVLPDTKREERWLEHWSQPIRSGLYAGGRIEHYYDITGRKQAEEALQESKRQLESRERFISSIVESIPSSLLVIDQRLRVVSVNRNFLEKSRREEQATLGRKIEEVFPQPLVEYTQLNQKVREVFRTGEPLEGGKVAYRAPGLPTRIYYYRLIPLNLSPDRGREKVEEAVENVMLLMDDITEQEKLGEEVRRAERHLASVVDSAYDLVVSMDPEGRILTWNRTAERTSGFALEEVKSQYLPDLCVEEEQQEMTLWLAQWAQGQFTKKSIEINLRTKTGKEVPISWTGSRMLDDEHRIVGLVAVGRDLTERKRLEAQLIQSAKLTSLGVMAGGIAHEIRNPLAISSAAAQLLLERPDDEQLRKEAVEKIYSGVQRTSYIIENLLKFARPPEERMVPMDITRALEETLSLLANQLKVQRVKLRKDFTPDLPQVVGNKPLLQQVFSNMILNACNAMPDGGSLTVVTRATEAGVEIQFADTGVGIPTEHLSKIFDPFFTTMPVGKGVGLGLSISYSIIQQHQGAIDVASQVGQGTVFTIRLPVGSR